MWHEGGVAQMGRRRLRGSRRDSAKDEGQLTIAMSKGAGKIVLTRMGREEEANMERVVGQHS